MRAPSRASSATGSCHASAPPRHAEALADGDPPLPPEALAANLDALAESRVLRRDVSHNGERPPLAPLLHALEGLGLSSEASAERLRRSRVAVFGLEGPGATAAELLARQGVGEVVLVDPFPARDASPTLSPAAAGEGTRAEVLAQHLAGTPGRVTVWDGSALTQQAVAEIASGADLLIAAFDRGFRAAHHWVNQVAVERGVPALFAEAAGPLGTVGPLVLAGQTACYTCYRMRAAAAEEDPEVAMRYEEVLDAQRRPRLAERPAFPATATILGGLLANEAIKLLVGARRPASGGRGSGVRRPQCLDPAARRAPPPGLPDVLADQKKKRSP